MTTSLLDRPAPAPAWPLLSAHLHLRDCWWDVMRACWSCSVRTPAR